MDSRGDLSEKIKLPILHIVKQAQNNHGIKYNDYPGYSIHCTRRIKNTRKSLNIKNTTKNQFLFKPFNSSSLRDHKFLELMVFIIERSMSRATMLIRSQSDSRSLFRLRRRLRKAEIMAQLLLSISREARDSIDSTTWLEIDAYSSWVRGTCNFHVETWSTAFRYLNRARRIYAGLGDRQGIYPSHRDDYTCVVSEIDQKLEVCRYHRDSVSSEDLCEEIEDISLNEFNGKNGTWDSVLPVFGTFVELTPDIMEYAGFKEFYRQHVAFQNPGIAEYQQIIKSATDFLNKSRKRLKIQKIDELFSLSVSEMTSKQSLFIFVYFWKHVYENQRDLLIVKALEVDGTSHQYRTGKSRSKLTIPERLCNLYSRILHRFDRLMEFSYHGDGDQFRRQREVFTILGGVSKARNLINKQKYSHLAQCCDQLSDLIPPIIASLKSCCDLGDDTGFWIDHLEKTVTWLPVWKRDCIVSMATGTSLYEQAKCLLELNEGRNATEMSCVSVKPMFFDIACQQLEYPSQMRAKQKREGFLGGLFNW